MQVNARQPPTPRRIILFRWAIALVALAFLAGLLVIVSPLLMLLVP
jgi:hypothetical protein